MNYEGARMTCRKQGLELAKIDSEEENEQARNLNRSRSQSDCCLGKAT